MTNKKIIYFNLISLVLLLLYMVLHLFIAGKGIEYVQSSGGGFSYANFDFFGFHIIDMNGNESGSLISPSIVMAILLFFNFVFLFKHKFSKQIVLNIVLLILTLFFYHIFLNDLNLNLELVVRSNSFWFSKLNLFGYEFFDNIEKTVVNGYNYSVFPIIISITYTALKLISRNEAE
ncbi:MAG: hypothetical protein SCH66_06765 [Methanolobus sp.]|nr:hypothetical protein [Methanolobus sp.]